MTSTPRRTDLASRLAYLERAVNELTRRGSTGGDVPPPTSGDTAINVRSAGAVGDGTTDDTDAFSQVAATGRIGYVPAGTYVLTAPTGELPGGYWFGEGELLCTGTGYDGEILILDKWVPQPINTVMVGDGHRNITTVGQRASEAAGNESGANVTVGHSAIMVSTKSQRNTAIGSGAAKWLGDYDRPGVVAPNGNARRNVWVGTDAGFASVWADRGTFVGSNAGKWAGDPDPIGHQHDFFDGVPSPSLAGIDAPDRWPNARADLVGPTNAPAQVAENEQDNQDNVGVGRNTLLHALKSSQCVAAGTNALAHGFLVRSSTAIGDGALRDGLNASFNTAVGSNALLQTASGQFNVAVGNNAMRLNTHTTRNVAMGYGALENLTGNLTAPSSTASRYNVAIGYGAAAASVSATNSIAIGADAAFNNFNNATAVGGSASAVTFGVAVGSGASAGGASGVAIGANASAPNTNSVAIGANAAANANNQIRLGGAGTAVVATGPITAGGFVRTAVYASGSRPSASTSGAGAMIFVTGLTGGVSKPLWSNGTAWVDATGTVVP